MKDLPSVVPDVRHPGLEAAVAWAAGPISWTKTSLTKRCRTLSRYSCRYWCYCMTCHWTCRCYSTSCRHWRRLATPSGPLSRPPHRKSANGFFQRVTLFPAAKRHIVSPQYRANCFIDYKTMATIDVPVSRSMDCERRLAKLGTCFGWILHE